VPTLTTISQFWEIAASLDAFTPAECQAYFAAAGYDCDQIEWLLAVEDIDRSRTKTKSPQTNGIRERFHKTALNEFYRIAPSSTLANTSRRARSSLEDR
jgi:hypothetical protein